MLSELNISRERIAAFCDAHHIRKLALFGSALRADFSDESDVDLLVEFDPDHIPGLAFFAMQDELADIIGRTVDLHTSASISRHFRNEILKEAEALYVAA